MIRRDYFALPRRRVIGEHNLQKALFEWKRIAERTSYPDLEAMFAIDHAGKRRPDQGAELKRRGVRAGIPDICLPIARDGYIGLWIELKSRTGSLSQGQKNMRVILERHGHKYVVVRTLQDGINVIVDYLTAPGLRSALARDREPAGAGDGSPRQHGQSGSDQSGTG